MTAIYGLAHFDDRAIETTELEAMAEALRYWGPDGGGVWTPPGRSAALGQLVAHNLPESVRERGPLVAADGSVLTVAARLDNRDELLRELGLRGDATESEIVVAAWEKWGRDTCEHLYGDWVFAAWDPAAKRLFIARDHIGNTSLYYHANASSIAFASSRKALFALPFVPRRLNELRLAQHLWMWIADGRATFHEEIFRLPGGHHLTATAEGVRVTKYWFPERISPIRLPSDSDYVERFLELYSSAVRTRMRTRHGVVTTLSAGLDSSSVTALAARNLGAAKDRLIAYTAVPVDPEIDSRWPGRLLNEWELAHTTAEWIGLDHRPLQDLSITPLASLERSLWLLDEPEYAAGNQYWIADLMEQSRVAGAGVVLTGQLGNGGVSWAGDQQRVIRGLLQGRWIDAMRGLAEHRHLGNTNLRQAVSAKIVAPLRAKLNAARFRRGWLTPASEDGFSAPAFDRDFAVLERMRREGYDPFMSETLNGIGQRLLYLRPDVSPVGAMWSERGAAYGLEVRDPTADVRLLEYCMAVPDEEYVRDGWDRSLMRRSMEGLLPPEIRHNRRRGMQGGDLLFRFRADARATAAALDEVTSAPLVRRYLDVEKMRTLWAAVLDTGNQDGLYSSFVLSRALLIALFLAREPFGD